jgi:hypothetical protein
MAMSTSRCFSRALSLVTVSLTAFVFATCAPSDTGPSPQPTGLRFANASAVLLIGAMQQFTPLLVFQDGSTQPAPSATTWRSADPSVAIVDAFGTGLVTGRMNGVTSILATYGNFTATLNLRVAPNYGGAWNGRFTPTKCGRVAAFPLSNFCSAIATPQDLQLSLTQAGLMATGTMTLFGAQGPVTATIDDDGALEVMGAVNPSSGNSSFVAAVESWRTTVLENSMAGTFSMRWTMHGAPDISAEFDADVPSLMRNPAGTATTAAPFARR